MSSWLLMPLSGASHHEIAPWAYWHARWMVLGWGVLLPLGALVARYFKVTRRQRWPQELDNKFWWHGHRVLQWGGVLAMSVGLLVAWEQGGAQDWLTRLHVILGWSIIALGWLQIVGALLRGSKGGPTDIQVRGDHYDMTLHRIWFERLHKSLGWVAVAGAVLTIVLGLVIADAPRWMAVVLLVWWLALAAAGWHWQRAGRCVDTYQAIWGPDVRHPGNRMQPIGWGIWRPRSQTQRHHG